MRMDFKILIVYGFVIILAITGLNAKDTDDLKVKEDEVLDQERSGDEKSTFRQKREHLDTSQHFHVTKKLKYRNNKKSYSFDRHRPRDSHRFEEPKVRHTFSETHEHIRDQSQSYGDNKYSGDSFLPSQKQGKVEDAKVEGSEHVHIVESHHEPKVKEKHHHHHHHHFKTIIKKVPEPYPVEKIVHVPVEKVIHMNKIVHVPVEKIVHVPKPYPVEKVVKKIVHVPVEKFIYVNKPYPVEKVVKMEVEKIVKVPVEKIVHVPVEKVVHVPKPYPVEKIVHVPVEKIVKVPVEKIITKTVPVEKIVEKFVPVPKPYPVYKRVPYPVEVKVPYPVEKKVPYPVHVEVEKKEPVEVQHKPYDFEKPSSYGEHSQDSGHSSYDSSGYDHSYQDSRLHTVKVPHEQSFGNRDKLYGYQSAIRHFQFHTQQQQPSALHLKSPLEERGPHTFPAQNQQPTSGQPASQSAQQQQQQLQQHHQQLQQRQQQQQINYHQSQLNHYSEIQSHGLNTAESEIQQKIALPEDAKQVENNVGFETPELLPQPQPLLQPTVEPQLSSQLLPLQAGIAQATLEAYPN